MSPIAITMLIVLMTRKNAGRNSLLFLLGFTVTLIALGLVGVTIFHIGDVRTGKRDGYIDLLFGAICFGLIIYTSRKKRDKQETRKVEGDIKPLKAIMLGSIFMFTNPTTFVIYISGLHLIGAAKLKVAGSLLSLAILTLVSISTLMVPIAIYFVVPQKADRILNSLRQWLAKHRKTIGIAVLAVLGCYLSAKGINTLFYG